jgi:hypothetical protein
MNFTQNREKRQALVEEVMYLPVEDFALLGYHVA